MTPEVVQRGHRRSARAPHAGARARHRAGRIRRPSCAPASTSSFTPSRRRKARRGVPRAAAGEEAVLDDGDRPRRPQRGVRRRSVRRSESIRRRRSPRSARRAAAPRDRRTPRTARRSSPTTCRKMIANGARLVLGTDAGITSRHAFGWADHHEMARWVQLGLTPAQAIVAATSRPAELLGITDIGHAGGRQERRLRRARRQPARRHPQHASDRQRLPARRDAGSRRAVGKVHRFKRPDPSLNRAVLPRRASFFPVDGVWKSGKVTALFVHSSTGGTGMGRFMRLSVLAAALVALGSDLAFAQTGAIGGVATRQQRRGASRRDRGSVQSRPHREDPHRRHRRPGRVQDHRPLAPAPTSSRSPSQGSTSFKREGITLTSDFTATVNAEMRVGAVAETVTVTGESPLIDTQSVTQRKVADARGDRRPADRQELPESQRARAGRADHAGVAGRRRHRRRPLPDACRSTAAGADQMPLVMNGMPFNNMNNTGGGYNTTLVVNTGTVQEMTVTTSGLSAEARSSGVLTNIIPKEGGNTYPRRHLRELRGQRPADQQPDRRPGRSGPEGGQQRQEALGPQPDGRRSDHPGQAVVLSAASATTVRRAISPACSTTCGPARRSTASPPTAACTATPSIRSTLVPNSQDLNQQAVGGDTWTRGETVNLTWQASSKNKVTGFAHFNQRLVDCNQCSAMNSPEAGVYFTHSPEYLLQSSWTRTQTEQAAVRRRLHVLQRDVDLRA